MTIGTKFNDREPYGSSVVVSTIFTLTLFSPLLTASKLIISKFDFNSFFSKSKVEEA